MPTLSGVIVKRHRPLVAALLALLAMLAFVPSANAQPTAELTNIRVGAHPGYDRIVFDLTALPATQNVKYVAQLVRDPSGMPVSLPGNAFLQVTMTGAAAHDANGNPTYTGPQTFTTPQLANVRAVALIGDFEGVVTVGLGLRHRAPVHMFTLTGPNRLVVDVNH
jgi:hypothetical protein